MNRSSLTSTRYKNNKPHLIIGAFLDRIGKQHAVCKSAQNNTDETYAREERNLLQKSKHECSHKFCLRKLKFGNKGISALRNKLEQETMKWGDIRKGKCLRLFNIQAFFSFATSQVLEIDMVQEHHALSTFYVRGIFIASRTLCKF